MLRGIKLKIIRIKEQKKLFPSNLKVYKKIIEYIANSNLLFVEKEEALNQILDMMLESQAEQTATDIMIGDYEEFCKSIIEEYTKDKSKVYTWLHYFQRAVMHMLFILIPGIIFFKIFYPDVNAGFNGFAFMISIGFAFILIPFTHGTSKRKLWASTIYFVIMIAAGSFFTTTQKGEWVNSWLIENTNGIFIVLIFIVIVIEAYKRFENGKYKMR